MKSNQPIVITGGAGFIGSAVLWELNKKGISSLIVVDNLASTEKWKNLVNRKFEEYVSRDEFLNRVKGNYLGYKPSAIIHLGACSSTTETNADFLMNNNTHYSQSLCEYAIKNNIRFINASSAATYGNGENGFSDNEEAIEKLKPLNMYGYSKHLFDLWLKRHNYLNKVVSLKFFNVYGPNEYHKQTMSSMIFKAFHQIRDFGFLRLFKSGNRKYKDGEQKRDFIYVKDCVDLIIRFLEKPDTNGIFNIGTGNARSWNELASACFSALKLPKNIEYVDMPQNLRGKYQDYTQAEMQKLRSIWPEFRFTSLEDGVRDYITNYLMRPDPYLEMTAYK